MIVSRIFACLLLFAGAYPHAIAGQDSDVRSHPRMRELKNYEREYARAAARHAMERADRLAYSALTAARVIYGKRSSRLGPYLVRCAGTAIALGRFEKADSFAREGLALPGGISDDVRASLLARLGEAYFGGSDYHRAAEYFVGALRISGESSPGFKAKVNLALGRTLTELGEIARALQHLKRALRATERKEPSPRVAAKKSERDSFRGYVLEQIGRAHEKNGETEQARMHYEKSLRARAKIKYAGIAAASLYNRLGILFTRSGEHFRAEPYLKAALRIVLEEPAVGNLLAGEIYNNLADLYVKMKRYKRAHAYLRRAIARVGPDAREQRIHSMARLALLYEKAGRRGSAAAVMRKTMRLILRYRSELGRHRSGFTARFELVFRKLVEMELSAGNLEAAFRADMLRRGLSIVEGLSLRVALTRGGIPAAGIERVAGLEKQLRYRIAARRAAMLAGRRVRASRLLKEIWKLERERSTLEAKLRAGFPEYARARDARTVSSVQIGKALRKHELFLSYSLNGTRPIVFFIAPGAPPRVVHLKWTATRSRGTCPGTARTLNLALRNLYTLTAAPGHLRGPFVRIAADSGILLWNQGKEFDRFQIKGKRVYRRTTAAKPEEGRAFVGVMRGDLAEDHADACARRLRRELRNTLFGSVPRKYRDAARRMIVVPDGPAYSLPFAALLEPDSRKEIVLAHSGAVWLNLRGKPLIPGKRKILAIGNPIYAAGFQPTGISSAKKNSARGALTRSPGREVLMRLASLKTTRSSLRELNRLRWKNLPGTQTELQAIARMAYSGKVRGNEHILSGLNANRARILALNAAGDLRDYRYMHFAVHGLFVARRPALNALVLSVPGVARGLFPRKLRAYESRRGPIGIDPYLRMDDIKTLELNAELVVLSACETSLGASRAGEGMVALPQAFLIAGARNVIASLWPVEDRVTTRMMTLLYANLLKKGLSPAGALRAAQMELRREYPDPYHWQAFVIYGE